MTSVLRLAHLHRFRNAYLFRGFAVWAGFRLFAVFLGIPDPNVVEKALILGVAALAVYVDARRREEDLFLGNLGVSGGGIVAWALPIPLLAEAFVL